MVLGSLSAVFDLSEAGDFGGFWNPRDASGKPSPALHSLTPLKIFET